MPPPRKIKWRVMSKPQMSAGHLSEYMSSSFKVAEGILTAAKYRGTIPVSYYEKAREPIVTFLTDPIRRWDPIFAAREKLSLDAQAADVEPKTRERLLNNIAVLDAFQAGYNEMGLGAYKMIAGPRQQPATIIEGVRVTTALDLIITGDGPKQQPLVGGVLFGLSKPPPLKTPEANARYLKAAYCSATLVHMHSTKHLKETGKAWFKFCIWADVQSKKVFVAQKDYKSLVSDLQAACRIIARGWDDVPKPPGFDPEFAEFY